MGDLTKEEKQWLRKMQNLLDKAPARFGYYTIGDPCISIFDNTGEHLFDHDEEFVTEVTEHDAYLADLKFPENVHSVRG